MCYFLLVFIVKSMLHEHPLLHMYVHPSSASVYITNVYVHLIFQVIPLAWPYMCGVWTQANNTCRNDFSLFYFNVIQHKINSLNKNMLVQNQGLVLVIKLHDINFLNLITVLKKYILV